MIFPMTRSRFLYLLALGWTIIIFIGCSLPGSGIPDPHGRDKWLHAIIFFLYGLLWRLAGRSVAWVLLTGFAYGYLIEVWQGLTNAFLERDYDIYDFWADAAGTVVGVLVAVVLVKVVKL